MTPYETCKLILSKKGSLKEVSKEIGRSIAYVSIMRKIARDATGNLLNAWGDGYMPFDLVRLVVAEDRSTQISIVNDYLETTRGPGCGDFHGSRRAKGDARAALLARLGGDNG